MFIEAYGFRRRSFQGGCSFRLHFLAVIVQHLPLLESVYPLCYQFERPRPFRIIGWRMSQNPRAILQSVRSQGYYLYRLPLHLFRAPRQSFCLKVARLVKSFYLSARQLESLGLFWAATLGVFKYPEILFERFCLGYGRSQDDGLL